MIWIALGMGVLLVFIGCPLLLKQWLIRKKYESVEGTCIACDKTLGKNNKKYFAEMSYTYAGRSYSNRLHVPSSAELEVGATYPCCCNPEHPSTVILYKNKHEPLFVSIICVLALIAAVLLVLWHQGIIHF